MDFLSPFSYIQSIGLGDIAINYCHNVKIAICQCTIYFPTIFDNIVGRNAMRYGQYLKIINISFPKMHF